MIITLLPIAIPLLLMIALLIIRPGSKWSRITGVAGTWLLVVVAVIIFRQVQEHGILVLQPGNWPAPVGISLVIDRFSAIMLLVSGIIGASVATYALAQVDRERLHNRFYLFFIAVLLGVNGAFTTGDVFNLYVWFEVMLIASFVLITLGSSKEQLKAAIKYVTMNLVGSLLFLAGIGILYGITGTLNMADLSQLLQQGEAYPMINTSAMLFFLAFGIKAAIFPLFFWLPASYHKPPLSVTALFAGLLTKVGVYSMIRFFTMFFISDSPFWQNLILIIAGFTMVVGVLTAASQYEMRRILSFHIISQVGYMVLGLGLFTVAGVAGAIFYMVHNMFAKTATFLAAGVVHRIRGTYDLKALGGLYKKRPLQAVLFMLPAMALAGIPPLSGFVGKMYLILAGFEAEKYVITAIAILVSLLTLFSMLKIWTEVFWKPSPGKTDVPGKPDIPEKNTTVPPAMTLSLALLALLTLVLGVFGGTAIGWSVEASEQLMNPQFYIEQVIHGGGGNQ